MNVFNNPYNEMLNPNVDFSDGYFDAIVNSIKNKGLLLAMLEKGKDDVEGSVDFLWNFLPIEPVSKLVVMRNKQKTFFGISSITHKN
ncbi:hypothetical protein ALHIDCOG_00400 [Klebsiella phage CPRSB]|nr:hypothetical protein ALHIDCOG_00400 [Klebsiella phage CPRSB]